MHGGHDHDIDGGEESADIIAATGEDDHIIEAIFLDFVEHSLLVVSPFADKDEFGVGKPTAQSAGNLYGEEMIFDRLEEANLADEDLRIVESEFFAMLSPGIGIEEISLCEDTVDDDFGVGAIGAEHPAALVMRRMMRRSTRCNL